MGIGERIMPEQHCSSGVPRPVFEARFVVMNSVETGTLSAVVKAAAKPKGASVSACWQVSQDSKRWLRSASTPNNPAAVPVVTGPGAEELVIPAPTTVYGFRYVRLVLTAAGPDLDDGDAATVSYNYREPAYS